MMAEEAKETLKKIRKESFDKVDVKLLTVKTYLKDRKQHYILRYIPIESKLKSKFSKIIQSLVSNAKRAQFYEVDSQDNDSGEVMITQFEESDFKGILEKLKSLNPALDVIKNADELKDSKAYMAVYLRKSKVLAVGYKILPENWKPKEKKGIFSVLFRNNRFEDLENKPVFSVSNTFDFIYYESELIILSKKGYERALNIRAGMIKKAEEFFEDLEKMKIVTDPQLLRQEIGDNMKLLRKVSYIMNTGYYKQPKFIEKLKTISEARGWDLTFEGGKIIISQDNVDVVLTVLSNKRLLSEITDEIFDVEHAKKIS